MSKVMRVPPAGLFRPEHRFAGGIAFLILVVVSIAFWIALISILA